MVDNECGCSCGCSADDSGDCSTDCVTNDAPTKVYACGGASNVGVISFDLSKALHQANKYQMGCSTCIGAGDCGCGGTVTANGKKDLLIDGCRVGCLKKMFEKKVLLTSIMLLLLRWALKKKELLLMMRALLTG